MRLLLLALVMVGTVALAPRTVSADLGESGPGVSIETWGSGRSAPARSAITQPVFDGVRAADAGTNIQVTYISFPEDARAAVEYAVSIWEALLVSPVDITVEVRWEELRAGLWGIAGFERVSRNFPGAPQADVWYPIPIANSIAGFDLLPDTPDIGARFNKNANWYLGTDGQAPDGTVDLVTLVLHELAHGLGFGSTFDMAGLLGKWGSDGGWPFLYDNYVENGQGQQLTNTALFPNPSVLLLGEELRSGDLFFAGPEATIANGGQPPQLYAPETWAGEASIHHLDEDAFPTGTANSMLTPFFDFAEVMHVPGPIVMGMLRDLGWETSAPEACLAFGAASLGNGTVKLEPHASPGCAAGFYAPGERVTMEAHAAEGWNLMGWSMSVGVADCPGCATTAATMPNTSQTAIATFEVSSFPQRLVIPQASRAAVP